MASLDPGVAQNRFWIPINFAWLVRTSCQAGFCLVLIAFIASIGWRVWGPENDLFLQIFRIAHSLLARMACGLYWRFLVLCKCQLRHHQTRAHCYRKSAAWSSYASMSARSWVTFDWIVRAASLRFDPNSSPIRSFLFCQSNSARLPPLFA